MSSETININKHRAIKWNTTIFMIIFHAGAIAALFMLGWKVVPVTLLLWWISGRLGIGMGIHRLLTHRGYKVPKAIEYSLTFCRFHTTEAGAINCVATPCIHHTM